MVYFIDFEATQFSNEIISIGCVNEKGETFYSLVQANPKKVTSFITKLTGITREEIRNAPSADMVFSDFFNWITKDSDKSHIFYVYGDTDGTFVNTNLKRAKDTQAICALKMINKGLTDYSKTVKKHYGLIKNIKLIKLVQYYRQEEVKQSHNALEDAFFLKEVYDAIQAEGDNVENPFPDYSIEVETEKKAPKPCLHPVTTNFDEPEDDLPHISLFRAGKFFTSFHSWEEVTDFIFAQEKLKSPDFNRTSKWTKYVVDTINFAIENNHKPWGYRWKKTGEVPKERN